MAITMLVQLYTSRVVLEVLGIEDYGIWNLVATLVVSISFITIPLSSVVQRFLSFEIGSNNLAKAKLIFSQSFLLYCGFTVVLLILLETIGIWLLNTKLQIPESKIYITNIVYQLSIFTFFLTLLRTPFDAAIIAYEKMDFYAYISVADVLFKLGIVFSLKLFSSNYVLIAYACLTSLTSFAIFYIYKTYCNKKYPITYITFKIDRDIFKQIFSYSGWSLLGAFALMTANQGINLILNSFFGVVINATLGIANQVGNAVNQFVGNFQVAFQPSIIKTYAKNDIEKLTNLIFSTSKFSFLLLFMISCPIIFNITPILSLWLGENVPIDTSYFCILIIISLIFDAMSAPLYMALQATGQIKTYQIAISAVLLLNILVSYILLSIGMPPISSMYVKCSVSILCVAMRFYFIHIKIGINIKPYFINVIKPILIVTLIMIGLGFATANIYILDNGLISLIIRMSIVFITYIIISILFALNKSERVSIKTLVLSKINNR